MNTEYQAEASVCITLKFECVILGIQLDYKKNNQKRNQFYIFGINFNNDCTSGYSFYN